MGALASYGLAAGFAYCPVGQANTALHAIGMGALLLCGLATVGMARGAVCVCEAVTPDMGGLVAVGMGAGFAYCPVGHADTTLHNDIVAIGMGALVVVALGLPLGWARG